VKLYCRWALLVGVLPTMAAADAGTVAIDGHVAMACQTRLNGAPVPLAAGVTQLGTLYSQCNDPAGFRVFADTSANLGQAVLIVDGKRIALQGGASTLVIASAEPAMGSHALALDLAQMPGGGTLSFRIQPL